MVNHHRSHYIHALHIPYLPVQLAIAHKHLSQSMFVVLLQEGLTVDLSPWNIFLYLFHNSLPLIGREGLIVIPNLLVLGKAEPAVGPMALRFTNTPVFARSHEITTQKFS